VAFILPPAQRRKLCKRQRKKTIGRVNGAQKPNLEQRKGLVSKGSGRPIPTPAETKPVETRPGVTTRSAYLGRVSSKHSVKDILDHLDSIGMETGSVSVTMLANKESYKSFRLDIPVDSFDQIVNVTSWPDGMVIRPFRLPSKLKAAAAGWENESRRRPTSLPSRPQRHRSQGRSAGYAGFRQSNAYARSNGYGSKRDHRAYGHDHGWENQSEYRAYGHDHGWENQPEYSRNYGYEDNGGNIGSDWY
jgi:hypothetical protein